MTACFRRASPTWRAYLASIAGNVADANGYLALLDTARRGEQTRVDNEDGTITYTTRHLWLEYDQIIDTWDTAAEYRQTTIQEAAVMYRALPEIETMVDYRRRR